MTPAEKRRRLWAIASVVAIMIVWGSTFAITKVAIDEIPPLTLAALRFLIAAVILVPVMIALGGLRRLPGPFPVMALVMMSLTGIVIFTIGFNLGMAYGSASQGAMIFALVPAAVAVAAVIALKERLSMRRIAGIALSVFGVALVVLAGEPGGEAPDPLLGAFWMIVGVAAWAVYTVFAKRLAAADQIVVIGCATVISAVMLLPLSIVELWDSGLPSPSVQGWLGVLFLGVFASALAYIVYSRALRVLEASVVGVYLNLDPIIGVLTAVLFLGETLYTGQIVGGVIAFAGMWLASTQSSASA